MVNLEAAPEAVGSSIARARPPAGADNPWRWPLLLGLVFSTIFWIVASHGDAAVAMVGTWWRSETFAHGLIIYPVSAWLIWRRRQQVAVATIEPCFWALAPLALVAAIGLLGDLGNVEAARQFGVVAMIPLAVLAILGTQVVRVIMFPLAFTLMAVPVGEFLLPMLMQHTADFTVAALRATGVPVYREGLFFTVPSGRWSVIEACSGLRYLIASLTLGLLYAYLSYTSYWRRTLFVAASILVPIIANWVRAYLIVMIGHLSGMKYAVGVDHLIYGWIFFGVVMLLLFWVGSWWREDDRVPAETAETAEAAEAPARASPAPTPAIVVAALAVCVVASIGPAYVESLQAHESTVQVALAQPAVRGAWQVDQAEHPSFRPHYVNARSSIHQSYAAGSEPVGLFIGYYAAQRPGSELIAFGNDLVAGQHGWLRVSEKPRSTGADGPAVTESRLQGAGVQLIAWHWFWVGGKWTLRPEEVKLRQAFNRLAGRGDDAAVVVLYTRAGEGSRDGVQVLERFLADMEPSVRTVLEAARTATKAGAAPTRP